MVTADLIAYAAIAYPILLFALTFHEWGHAMSAKLLGDRTAELQGRLTMNPLSHIDPIGTVVIPLLQMLTPGVGHFLFGWANPVPVNPLNLRRLKDIMWVALAGPACNLVLVAISVITLKILLESNAIDASRKSGELLFTFFQTAIQINLVLFLFNLIPIAPLDGSKVVLAYVRGHSRAMPFWQAYEVYGPFVLIVLLVSGGFQYVLGYPLMWSYGLISRFLM